MTVTLTGWYSAKPCIQLGSLSSGTNAVEQNVSGNSQVKPPTGAASTVLTLSPMTAEIQAESEAEEHEQPRRRQIGPTRLSGGSHEQTHDQHGGQEDAVADDVAHGAADEDSERAIGRERNRSMIPFVQVFGEPDAGADRAERHRLDEDAGHEEVDVVAAGDLDVGASSTPASNSKTNITGWMIENTSSSGMRNCTMLRQHSTHASANAQ